MKKKLLLLIVLVAAAAAGAAFKLKNRGPEAIDVEVASVSPVTIVQTVRANGRIQPKTQVSISADVSGKITRLAVKDGDWVEEGALLLELDRERYQAALEVAQAILRASQSNAQLTHETMIKAEKDYERARGLYDRKLEPQASLDAAYATAQAEKARSRSSLDQVEQARASLKQSQDDLSKTRIFAPLSGTVSKVHKEVGEIALGSQFQKDVIIDISNLSGMEAVVDVDENDVVLLALADPAAIEVDALPGVKLKGEVAEIAASAKVTGTNTADQKTEFEVKVSVTDPNSKLRPGMTATAEVTTETKDAVLGVPLQCVALRSLASLKEGLADGAVLDPALKPDDDGFVEVVFLVQDGKSEVRQVKTGIQSESHIEVTEGLHEGDRIVVGNYRAISKDLQQGSLVKAKDAAAPGTSIAHK